MQNYNLTPLGGGAGLRHHYFDEIINGKPPFRWFEIISEDFMGHGGYERECLLEIRRHYPIIGHGVCLSIGSTDPLNREYLKNLKLFLDDIESPWTSDHLCFTMVDHTNLNELIPLPFTDECVRNVVERVKTVQQMVERPFMLENVTRYLTLSDREMSEAEFVARIVTEADCGLLLDLTNVALNSKFHGYDPYQFLKALPLERVGQIHLAGWETDEDGRFIDSHDAPVPDEVWDLFRFVIARTGPSSVLIERDNNLPPLHELLNEAEKAHTIMEEAAVRQAA